MNRGTCNEYCFLTELSVLIMHSIDSPGKKILTDYKNRIAESDRFENDTNVSFFRRMLYNQVLPDI